MSKPATVTFAWTPIPLSDPTTDRHPDSPAMGRIHALDQELHTLTEAEFAELNQLEAHVGLDLTPRPRHLR